MVRNPAKKKRRMRKTSNDSKGVSFTLALAPVPCPRPRIRVMELGNGKRMGVAYYTGKYKNFSVDAPKAIPKSKHFFAKGLPLKVHVEFFMRRPAKPANPYPVGDIDNYCKSILDAITKNGSYWHDDSQVVELTATKEYCWPDNPEPSIEVTIREIT